MTLKTKLYFLAVILIAAGTCIYLFSGQLITGAASKMCGLDITYEAVKNNFFQQFIFTGIRVMDTRKGVGFSSKHAGVRPVWANDFITAPEFSVNMKDVSFIRNGPHGPESYSSLDNLVALPFEGQWTYHEISGKFKLLKEGVRIDGFLARSDDIKVSLNGYVYKDGNIKNDIITYFSKRLVDKIPEALSKVVLQEEPDGWHSLSVNLSGNYSAPSIQVSSKLFRLNIRTVTEAD